MVWCVYVLLSTTRSATYVGIAKDPDQRLAQHNGLAPGGAKATRAGRPWTIGVRYGPYESRGDAQRAEHVVKRARGRDRLALDLDRQ